MTEPLLNGIFLLAASVIGSMVTLFATRHQSRVSDLKDQNEKIQSRLVKILYQVESYHHLEELYANSIASEKNSSVKSVKIDFRDRVVEMHNCERPKMTANEAKNQISRIS